MSASNDPRPGGRSGRVMSTFERAVIVALVVMMMVVIAASTIDLGRKIVLDLATPPVAMLEVDELLDVFGFFLLIIIGLELLDTIKAYLGGKLVRVEVVIEVALIAVARKVIVLDLAKYDGVSVLAIAALIITLAAAYYIVPLRRKLTGAER